jgi:hypothetical protein
MIFNTNKLQGVKIMQEKQVNTLSGWLMLPVSIALWLFLPAIIFYGVVYGQDASIRIIRQRSCEAGRRTQGRNGWQFARSALRRSSGRTRNQYRNALPLSK